MFPGLRMPKGEFLREAFMKNYEFWFIVGSQTLYGPEVLETVDARAREMAAYLTERLPYPLVYKGTAKSAEEIFRSCAGGQLSGEMLRPGYLVPHFFAQQDVDQRSGGFAEALLPFCDAI